MNAIKVTHDDNVRHKLTLNRRSVLVNICYASFFTQPPENRTETNDETHHYVATTPKFNVKFVHFLKRQIAQREVMWT